MDTPWNRYPYGEDCCAAFHAGAASGIGTVFQWSAILSKLCEVESLRNFPEPEISTNDRTLMPVAQPVNAALEDGAKAPKGKQRRGPLDKDCYFLSKRFTASVTGFQDRLQRC